MRTVIALSPALFALAATDLSANALDEVVVTATKRVESLQDVPVSVAAVGGAALRDMGVADVDEVAIYIPNFEASISPILPNLYVRGIGTGTSHSIEQSVGRFVDDVYIGRGAASMLGLLDVQAIEVLRGPQGTLFGKNTLAGAMIVRTGNPTAAFESSAGVSFGSYETQGNFGEFDGYLSGPLGETTRARIAVRYVDSDGYVENRLNGPDGGEREELGARVKIERDLTSRTTAQLRLEYGELKTTGSTSLEIVGPPENNPGIANVLRRFSPGWTADLDWKADYACAPSATVVPRLPGFCPGRDQDVGAAVLRVTHQAEHGEFLSVTAFQQYEFIDRFYAIDMGIAGGAYSALRDEEYDSLAQEFRYTSESNGRSDYIVGLYLEDTDLTRYSNTDFDLTVIPGAPIRVQQNEVFDQVTRTAALFGQYRRQLSDRLSLSLGARVTYEEKEYKFSRNYEPYGTPYQRQVTQTVGRGPFGPLEAAIDRPLERRDETKFTPSLNLRYQVSDSAMVFASFAQGYKAGGFSDRVSANPADSIQYDAETANAAELGFKGQFLDGAAEVNVTAFYMLIDDLQVSSSVPGTVSFQVQNAAEAVSRGVELDGRWAVGSGWLLGGNLAYTDAYYERFPAASCTPGQAAARGAGCTQDLSGRPLIFAPEWKGTLYAQYTAQLPQNWELSVRADVSHSSSYWTETPLSPGVFQESYEIYNASVWLASPSRRYRVGFIGRNLSNEAYRVFGLASPGSSIYLAEPNLPARYSLNFGVTF